jgi:protein ImuB
LGVEELDREPDVDRAELVGLLHRLGLRSLGAFGALDPQDVGSRFGADAVLAHRLARGLDPRPPVRRQLPEELTVTLELDPPVDRVDAAAFAARGLAERLHHTLAGHGLSCTRLGVAARTVGGERLFRVWRCAEPLTPAGTVDRVRWQLDSWLTRGGSGAVDRLWLVPEETVAAGALQLGLWGDIGAADERAGRALVRVQALLGPESVVTAVLVGGRDPAERVRLVPWGDARDAGDPSGAADPAGRPDPGVPIDPADRPGTGPLAGPAGRPAYRPGPEPPAAPVEMGPLTGPDAAPAGWPGDELRRTGRVSAVAQPGEDAPRPSNRRRRPPARRSTPRAPGQEPPPPWPGRLPAPSPAVVFLRPLPAELLDVDGRPVELAEPDRLTAPPAGLAVDGGRLTAVHGWAGPWPVHQRWWAGEAPATSRLQALCADGTAHLLCFREGRWWVSAVYD